jgi:hypothetical protein
LRTNEAAPKRRPVEKSEKGCEEILGEEISQKGRQESAQKKKKARKSRR